MFTSKFSFFSNGISTSLVAAFASFCFENECFSEVFFLNAGKLSSFDGNQADQLVASSPDAVKLVHLHDWKQTAGVNRFLLSKKLDKRHVPNSDAPSGFDLWLQNGSGAERQVHASVFRAKFSPDAKRVAYTTTDCELFLEDLHGKKLKQISRAYNPSWKRDGSAILFEKVPDGRKVHYPETLHLARFDLKSGKEELLTDGQFDDVRPEFHPSGKWILFVSGGRTGLASFWQIDAAGGKPVQLTNLGRRHVDENFVPTPYRQTIWSADGRWFLYDFKSGDVQQVWGLEFGLNGKLVRTIKLANGLNPQWDDDGKIFVYLKQTDSGQQPVVEKLP